ncbi:lanC-like protein 3 homolog [Neocloeon triangulifer]|uniref:lanC-like protein 3 homolog n=1 Tax=Neocloeon triangulifer TaxID=2078957 RepID=UPI00286EFA4B|nr:lanC-like protein 3 homolog [Neocloeon triangulifer]
MSAPKRYFPNNLPIGEDCVLSKSVLKCSVIEKYETIVQKQQADPQDAEGGLYVGIAGIGYLCYHLSKSPIFQDSKGALQSKAKEYLEAALEAGRHKKGNSRDDTAFILGNAGLYAICAAVFNDDGFLRDYAKGLSNCLKTNFISCGSDELFVGRAGYVMGILWLRKTLQQPVIADKDLMAICTVIVESGRQYARHHRSPCPLMYAYYGTEYLGAAHGLCAILQALLSVPSFISSSDPSVEKDIRTSVDYLLSLQTPSGNFPSDLSEIGRGARPEAEELVHWCHGAPGIVYLMAKAYLVWSDEKYLQAAVKCAECTWNKGLLRKGPGICHGVAGSGYVFLLLFRLTGEQHYLQRAHAFAQFIDSEEFKPLLLKPDSPYSLYEGLAGTCCFLDDLAHPESAAFPFSDVF